MHYIKYKEQDYPVKIDFAVVKNVCAKHKEIKLTSIPNMPEYGIGFQETINTPEYIPTICYEALKRGAILDGKEFNLTEDDIIELLSESVLVFSNIFIEEVILKMYADPDKKKQ